MRLSSKMATSLKRIWDALGLLCLVLSVVADGPPFPHLSDLEVDFYETEVQITDLNLQVIGVAKEYYDDTAPRGKLELTTQGKTVSIIYDKDINEVLEVRDSNCQTWGIDESTYVYEATFYGWLNANPLIIGPSAALWTANNKRNDIVYTGIKKIRNILCDSYTLQIKGPKENVILTYYFAGTNWETPYQVDKLRVPIRIDANGKSSIGTGGPSDSIPINISTDFFYFRPYISDWLVFQPPLRLGCPLRKPTRTMPKMPSEFKYSAEVVDVLENENKNSKDSDRIEYQKVWYDGLRSIARLDKHNTTDFFSELYDFNTGVTYRIEHDMNCTIKPLRNSFFEAYDNELIGRLKEPSEVFNLDGTFYYMGRRLFRGIWCDSFESVQMDTIFMKQNVSKLVVTIFYSEDPYEVEVDGENENKVPVYHMVTGYKDNKKIINLQYNIFEFDDIIYPPIYTTYRLEKCFPRKDKSYFVMLINVEEELIKQIEHQEDVLKVELSSQISKYAKISEMRIKSLSVDYKPTGVTITGLILERPPALSQFFMEFEGEVEIADKYLKPVVSAETEEKCAFSCVDNDDFECLGFYFCQKACFLKSKGLFDRKEDDENVIDMGESCKTWMRVTRHTTNSEAYLVDALKSLENAVTTNKMSVPLVIDDTITTFQIAQVAIGARHFTGPPFPHISDLEVAFYETEVQITDLNQQVFGIAKEYYDSTVPRGKLELKAVGNTQSVFYNNNNNEILEVNAFPKMWRKKIAS